MNRNKEFFEQIDKIVKREYESVLEAIVKTEVKVRSFSFDVAVDENLLKQYSLNKDIRLIAETVPDSISMRYLYKDMPLEPINYYLRPDDYHEVSTLQILEQCIAQDTHKPDIMFLERGEKELSS